METYLIPIGENEDLCERVQKALFAAGFERALAAGGSATTVNDVSSGTLSLNRGGSGLFTRTSFNSRTFMSTEPSSDVLLAPSYVLAHASDLDGAKKPWEIPPEGYRLVTDEERGMEMTDGRFAYLYEHSTSGWCFDSKITEDRPSHKRLAVPIGFTFAPPVARMTHAQICKALGKNIEIIKESE